MSSIRLHEELGVNPRLVTVDCQCCGREKQPGQELLLLGSTNHVYTCRACKHIGWPKRGKCQRPDCNSYKNFDKRKLEPHEAVHLGTGTCSECESFMGQGVILISTKDEDEGKPNPYRTGGWCVVKDEAITRMVQPPELAQQILAARMCYIPDTVWDTLGLPRNEEIDNRGGQDAAPAEPDSQG